MNLSSDIFEPLLAAYAEGEPLSNATLYEILVEKGVFAPGAMLERVPVGLAQEPHNPCRRRVRWMQQTLRGLGLLERVPGERGVWRSTAKARGEFTPAPRKTVLLGFSTRLGLALWGDCIDAFTNFNEPIHAVVSSPPYPLARGRAYGAVTEIEYVDFICSALEPLLRNLVSGGSVALNLSNDVFLPGIPARSLYRERLVLELSRRFGLSKMDTIVWADASKAPGPIAWASKKRVQLHVGYEPVYIFTNDPTRAFCSNQRVLLPHTDAHKKLVARGGESRNATYGDGANRIAPGAFSNPTSGRIPTNVFTAPHRCRSQDSLRKYAKAEGLPIHSATFPLSLAKFLVEFLTEKDQLLAEPFAGWFSGPLAAELTGRRWVASEKILQLIEGARFRFKDAPGFSDAHRLAF